MSLEEQLKAGPDVARVRSVRIKDGIATVLADAYGLGTAERDALEQRLRSAALAKPGVTEVRVALTAAKQAGPVLLAVGSGKGGVGKSTVAANLAVALARLGKRVGMIDADIYGPSQPTLLGVHAKPEAEGKQLIPTASEYGVDLLSVGQLVSAGHALAWRGPMASGALSQLVEGDWRGRDILVIDLPPGTGDVQLSLIQKWKPAGAVIVSTPQDLALIDATRAIDLFRKMNVPIFGLVENMSGYACPHCGEVSDPFGSGGAEAAAKVMRIPFLGRVPLTLTIRRSSDEGTPPAAGEGEEAVAFAGIAERLLEEMNPARG